jgi:hypothetical protein
VQGEKRARSFVAEILREEILAPGPRNEITHIHGLLSKDLSERTARNLAAVRVSGQDCRGLLGHMTLPCRERGAAALARRYHTPRPPPVFALAIMVATCSWVFSGVHDMPSAAAKPAIKSWGAACANQGPLDATMLAFAARQNEILFRLNKIALFCFCVGMTAELISSFEDYYQST